MFIVNLKVNIKLKIEVNSMSSLIAKCCEVGTELRDLHARCIEQPFLKRSQTVRNAASQAFANRPHISITSIKNWFSERTIQVINWFTTAPLGKKVAAAILIGLGVVLAVGLGVCAGILFHEAAKYTGLVLIGLAIAGFVVSLIAGVVVLFVLEALRLRP